MLQPKLRRALAALALTFAAAFATVPGAGAAVHPRPAYVRAVETPFSSWLREIVKAVAKDIDIGVRIDPDGIH